jgi:hypothetical protein
LKIKQRKEIKNENLIKNGITNLHREHFPVKQMKKKELLEE